MLDFDLAELYEIETKRLKEAVRFKWHEAKLIGVLLSPPLCSGVSRMIMQGMCFLIDLSQINAKQLLPRAQEE